MTRKCVLTLGAALWLALAPLAAADKPVALLNVSYDPTRELYQDFNARLHRSLAFRERPEGGRRTVARRLRQAGAVGDRRPRSRRGDAGAGRGHRRHRPGRPAARRLAEAPAAQQHALHLDHRLPGAQGQPQGHPRLGRPGAPGRVGRHAQPEDLGRSALELPRRLGLGAARATARRTRRAQYVAALYRNVPVLDTGARGSTVTFVERGIGDVLLAWENEALLSLKEFGATSSRSSRRRCRFSPSRRWRWSIAWSTARHTRKVAEAYLQFLYSRRARRSRRSTSTGRDRRRSRRGARGGVSRRSSCSPSTSLRRLEGGAGQALRRGRRVRQVVGRRTMKRARRDRGPLPGLRTVAGRDARLALAASCWCRCRRWC